MRIPIRGECHLVLPVLPAVQIDANDAGYSLELVANQVVGSLLEFLALIEGGASSEQIRKRFDDQTEEARDYAYGMAAEVKESQDSPERQIQ